MIFYTCFSIAFSCKFTCMVTYLTHWEVLMTFYTRMMETKISDRWLWCHLQSFPQMNVKFHGALLIISSIQVVGCCRQPTSHYLGQDQHPHIVWPGWNESYDVLKKQVFGRFDIFIIYRISGENIDSHTINNTVQHSINLINLAWRILYKYITITYIYIYITLINSVTSRYIDQFMELYH